MNAQNSREREPLMKPCCDVIASWGKTIGDTPTENPEVVFRDFCSPEIFAYLYNEHRQYKRFRDDCSSFCRRVWVQFFEVEKLRP